MAHFKVSGQIINELSEKIPTNIVALNELIKNSFDANANNVTIKFDSRSKFLSIIDDGEGMDEKDIDVLLHISNSNKKYASQNSKGRYIQGSKGLGVLSVFKFGDYVTWTSKKKKGCQFCIDYNELIKHGDINSYNINVNEVIFESTGTKIDIRMRDEQVDFLKDYFSEERNILKILNSFKLDDFNLSLIIDDTAYNNKNNINILDIETDKQLYNVTYDSKIEKIIFKHNTHVAFIIDFPFKSNEFKMDLDLVIFHLPPHGKSKISSLFYNDLGELTPLIYVNTNLFNNYSLFSPSIMRSVKSTSVLSQMIGYINIYSNNPLMNFNSDRTQFIQNKLTNEIIDFLNKINIEIQQKGSENKSYLIDMDILNKRVFYFENEEELKKLDLIVLKNNIKDSFSFKDSVNIVPDYENSIIKYSVFGKEIRAKLLIEEPKRTTPVASKITLKKKNIELEINSNQINLRDYISQITNSSGVIVSKNDVIINCKYGNCNNGILESPKEPYNEFVTYKYTDKITSVTREFLTINFVNNNPKFTYSKNDTVTIPNPIKNGYCLDSDNSFNEVVEQINSLNPPTNYFALIACSIRSIFELGADDLRASGKYDKIDFDPDLSIRIKNIVEYAQKEKPLITQIDNNTALGYKNLIENVYIPDDYKNAIAIAHRGAHKASKYLTLEHIKDLGNKVSYYTILINEMLKYK